MTTVTSLEWDRFLQRFPDAHLLQTSAWGDFKACFGWQVERVIVGATGGSKATGAQILFRRLPLGFTFAYLAKGPVGKDWASLWPEVDRVCRRKRAVLLQVEPDCWEPASTEETAALAACFPGFAGVSEPVQPRRTITISLEGGEEDWLARMKQKTRYNIRLAEKKGVQVNVSSDLAAFYSLMQVTGQRDGFGVHSLEYFQKVYDLFHPLGACDLLMAEFEGRPLAGLMVFARGSRSWYLYGASNDEERSRMPTYLLQWEAMRWSHAKGCQEYDLWGVPDADEQALEAGFTERSDGLWGVYRFKRGYGGALRRSAGAWDRPYLPLVYPIYQAWERRRHKSE